MNDTTAHIWVDGPDGHLYHCKMCGLSKCDDWVIYETCESYIERLHKFEQARREREHMDADAKLGALVRAMPQGYKLWYRNHHNVWEVRINQELVSAGDTPEDALKSAGVVLRAVA